jgi:hypothetical protein
MTRKKAGRDVEAIGIPLGAEDAEPPPDRKVKPGLPRTVIAVPKVRDPGQP